MRLIHLNTLTRIILMDDATLLEIQINNIIMNTTYSRETAIVQLHKMDNSHIKVINDYLENVKPHIKATATNSAHVTNTINQEIFTQYRHLLDTAMVGYNERQEKTNKGDK